MGNLGYRLVSSGVPVSKPQVLRKILPRVFTVFGTKPALLALFGWHSCCRGGATHGYGNGVPVDLLAPHWGWFTVQGLKASLGLVYRARTEGLHHGRLRSAAICHLTNVMPCITNFFILRMPVCSEPNFLV